MLKKIIRFFIGPPASYVSPVDHFLAKVRKRYPQSSASQIKEMQQHQEIAQQRDGTVEEVSHTTP